MSTFKATKPIEMEEIDLHGRVHSKVKFTRILLPIGWKKPLVVVRYMDNDLERGLGFDTGKLVFLTHTVAESKEAHVLSEAIEQIMPIYRAYIREKKIEELKGYR